MTDTNYSAPVATKASLFGAPSKDWVDGKPWGSVYPAGECGMVALTFSGACLIMVTLTPEIARQMGMALLIQADAATNTEVGS